MKLRSRIFLATIPFFLAVLVGSAPSWPAVAGMEVPVQLSGFVSGVLLTAALLFVTGVPFAAAGAPASVPQQKGFQLNLLQATEELKELETESARQNALDLEAAHRRALAQLQEEKNRLQLILDSATGVAVVSFDSSGVVNSFNIGAERMFGYLAADVLGLATVDRFIDPEELSRRCEGAADRLGRPASAIEGLAEVLRYKNEEETTVSYLHKSGRKFTGQVCLSRLRDAIEPGTGLLAISRDITKSIYKPPVKPAPIIVTPKNPPVPVKLAIAETNADIPLLHGHLDRFGKENPELAQSLAQSFLEASPPAFERLIASVLSEQWTEASDAVRELRAGACRVLLPELDIQLNQIEKSLMDETPNSEAVPIEPTFALYQLGRAVTRDWLSTRESMGAAPQIPKFSEIA